ncbi:MAG: 50S ribosomal protein L29 [Actinomycetota bacterium]
MRTSELREQTIEELQNRLEELKKSIFNIRFQKATGQLENPMRIRNLKKEVAVIKTLIREKQLGINQ